MRYSSRRDSLHTPPTGVNNACVWIDCIHRRIACFGPTPTALVGLFGLGMMVCRVVWRRRCGPV